MGKGSNKTEISVGYVHRALAFVPALLLVAGCLDNPAPEPEFEPVTEVGVESETAPAPAIEDNATSADESAIVVQPPRFSEVGMSWSACVHRGANGWFRLEWGEGLVPPEYRVHSSPGEIGEFRLAIMACEAVSIGNATFIPNATLAYFGILVDAPREMQGAGGGNVFLLALLTDSDELLDQFHESGVPAGKASFSVGEGSYSVFIDAALFAEVQPLDSMASGGNQSDHGRLHWKMGESGCWTDRSSVRDADASAFVAIFHGASGAAEQLSGPLQETRAASLLAKESGGLAPPVCLRGPS